MENLNSRQLGIGELTALLNVADSTVKHWAQQGVLVTDPYKKHRRYDEREVIIAHVLASLAPYHIPAPVLKIVAEAIREVADSGPGDAGWSADAHLNSGMKDALAGRPAFLMLHVDPQPDVGGRPRVQLWCAPSRAKLEHEKDRWTKYGGAAVIEIDLRIALDGARRYLNGGGQDA